MRTSYELTTVSPIPTKGRAKCNFSTVPNHSWISTALSCPRQARPTLLSCERPTGPSLRSTLPPGHPRPVTTQSQGTASGAGTPSRGCTEAGDQQFLLTFCPNSTHNYGKRKEDPDFSVSTKNHGLLRDLVCEGPILSASLLARLTSCGAYRDLENTRFLLKFVVSDKIPRLRFTGPHPSPADEAPDRTGHVAAATQLFTPFVFSFR